MNNNSNDEFFKKIESLRKEGKKIVTYNGSFDLVHAGHILSIHEAKQQGDILVLLVNSDASIKKYKSSKRPIVPQKERVEVLAALRDVDFVELFDDINPKKILGKIKPDVHCNGDDWGENCIERETVEKNGGRMHVLSWENGVSTTNIINKILNIYKTAMVKAVFLDRDGTINENNLGYVHKIEDFTFLPGVIEGLKRLSATDYKIIIVTNQSGIGRGYFNQEDFDTLSNWLHKEAKENNFRIDKIYHCPHTPEENCECRKPAIGMLMQSVTEFDISLNDSWLIGDQESDVIMGREANVKTIKIGDKIQSKLKLEPNIYAQNFLDAVSYILK